jgi:hypothetical protein
MIDNVVFGVFIVKVDLDDIFDGCFLGGRHIGFFGSRFWGDQFCARTGGNARIARNETVKVVFALDILGT